MEVIVLFWSLAITSSCKNYSNYRGQFGDVFKKVGQNSIRVVFL